MDNVGCDVLPAEAEPPISEDIRQRGIVVLQELFASGKVDQDGFQQALEGLLSAQSATEYASVIRALPPPVPLTPPALRRQEPLEISASMGAVRLDGRWQVGHLTNVVAGMGAVVIDLREAEFDDWDVDIVVHTTMGAITVIVPPGLDLRLVGRNGAVDATTLEPPIPGFPLVRLSATSDMGTISVVHAPKQPSKRRRRRRRKPPTLS